MILAGLSGAAPLATDMYVPALPQVSEDLGVDVSGVQTSLTFFLAGMVAGQLVLGPMSDQIGRRRILLGGTAAFTCASCACVVGQSIAFFDIARLVQGFGGAAGVVVARAVVTDLFPAGRSATVYARLGAATALAPVAAPVLGGGLLVWFSWRSIFVVLGLLGAALFIAIRLRVPETLPRASRSRATLRHGMGAMARVAARPRVVSAVLVVGFAGATVFAYIASNTFVFHTVYGMSTTGVSVVYGANAAGNMLGSVLFGSLVRRWSPEGLVVVSTGVAVASGVAFLSTVVVGADSVATTWSLLFVIVASFGITFPGALTLAQERGRDAAGATSALLGAVQFLFGAGSSPIVGAIGGDPVRAVAVVMVVTLIFGWLAAIVTAVQGGRISARRG